MPPSWEAAAYDWFQGIGRLGRADRPDPDANAGKQHEGREGLDEFVVSGGDAA